MTIKVFFLSLIASLVTCFNLFNLQFLSQKNGAACLDGSAPGIYTYFPDPQFDSVNVSKILIHFEGIDFGWCVQNDLSTTLENCHKYAIDTNEDWGSSNNLPYDQDFLFGIMSSSSDQSPGLHDWAKVIIKSCDGTGFQGYRSQPIVVKRQKLYFRGYNNTMQAFRYLNNSIGLFTKFTDIILSGSLNGAIAAMQYSQYVKANAKGKVSLLADAAVYRDQLSQKQNTTQQYLMRKKFQTLVSFVNQQIGLPSAECQAFYKDQPWRCFFMQYLYPFVHVPTFYTAALYDAWSIIHVLGFNCADLYTLSPCLPFELDTIQEWHVNTTKFLNQLVSDTNNGAWSIACVAHDFVWGKWQNPLQYAIPQNSLNTPAHAFMDWYLNKNVSHVLIESIAWPDNKNCAHKLATLTKQ